MLRSGLDFLEDDWAPWVEVEKTYPGGKKVKKLLYDDEKITALCPSINKYQLRRERNQRYLEQWQKRIETAKKRKTMCPASVGRGMGGYGLQIKKEI